MAAVDVVVVMMVVVMFRVAVSLAVQIAFLCYSTLCEDGNIVDIAVI